MINWKVRIRNKAFWLALIPAVLLLAVVNQLFALLTILGVVNDPTTAGLGDSEQAMGYEVPKE